jgi:rhodanese-related sulfurtransferase
LCAQEFADGHIRGATNVVVDKFKDDADLDAIIAAHVKGKGKETVVVHCQLSQQRGPFAARR